jgi:hypothetical protein
MARGTGAAENLHIGFDQASEKATEWPLWFEVPFGILLKGLQTARGTKVVRTAFIGASRGVRIPRLDLHPAYRIHKIILCISSHQSIQPILIIALLQHSNTPLLPQHWKLFEGLKPWFR